MYVADTTGELRRFIQAATVVFVGRSLPPHTHGQSPIEAAAYGKPILMGPGMRNFTDVAEELVRRGAAVSTPDARALEASLRKILLDTDLRKRLGKSGQDWFLQNRGSVERTMKYLLTDTSPAV